MNHERLRQACVWSRVFLKESQHVLAGAPDEECQRAAIQLLVILTQCLPLDQRSCLLEAEDGPRLAN